jgi:hypothetical protein
VDEEWYRRRKSLLDEGRENVTTAAKWKGEIKFNRPSVRKFLERIRPIAASFIADKRL